MKKDTSLSKSKTNWERLRTMKDSEIDYSDIPPITPDVFAKGVVRRGFKPVKLTKVPLTVRVDREVLKWYQALGRGYQTKINALLRAFMEASKAES
jgi:uncharacterized protein (DUF4415 family)